MVTRQSSHDMALLDALIALPETDFNGTIWRVVHGNRLSTDGSKGAGRWNLRESDVLYCALESDGAMSEIHFHISRGQSVFPSKLQSVKYELHAQFTKVLDLRDTTVLRQLGIDLQRYQEMLYSECQKIGEAVGFLGFEAMLVPNARHKSANLVVFLANCDLDNIGEVNHQQIDWRAWRQAMKGV